MLESYKVQKIMRIQEANMKAKTIKQFKILQWIKERFMLETLNIELLERNLVRIIDRNNDSMYIKCDKNSSMFIDNNRSVSEYE